MNSEECKVKNMKKVVLGIVAVVFATSCGNKTQNAGSETDSTAVEIVPGDTIKVEEDIVKQVNAVYDYLAELREHYDENLPSVDERFGSKEWQQVREEVAAVDRECECGGFFDFGDEGPLDAWTYDCYEGRVSADSIQVKLQPDGTAEVSFLVKDAVTIKGIPMRWQMRMEEGQWRVDNIIFAKDEIDLLKSMQAYVEDSKSPKTEPEASAETINLNQYAE
jgi:hypothetical protein